MFWSGSSHVFGKEKGKEMGPQKSATLAFLVLAVILTPAAEAKTIPQGVASVESRHETTPGRVWTANRERLTSHLSSPYAGLMDTRQEGNTPTQACDGGVRLSTAVGTVAAAAVAGLAAGVALSILVWRPNKQRHGSKPSHVRKL
ncbi:PREDICTED: uncharacterized protein LOC109475566 isoform X2 [Branchiostoma belcheri]|uniref:Uncharacterized protein LOC109475566 isoform X2 n=1 Tax=Branchiostoma belcheri TaxID=7741 RepID=A0A6P4Z5B9_BRABE|nr:PREDICTED: uncharacterized protein LOC109475566 isoform X2 [Branchiostoma belcheri]